MGGNSRGTPDACSCLESTAPSIHAENPGGNPMRNYFGGRRGGRPTKGQCGQLYASKFEAAVCEAALDFATAAEWDKTPPASQTRISYQLHYVPDLILPNGVVIEIKGHFPPEDRRKMLAVIRSNPQLDVRMVFQDPYRSPRGLCPGEWCDRHGIRWADRAIPRQWFTDPPSPVALVPHGS